MIDENEENYDKNGNINWDYVDADAYEDVRNWFKDDETFYEYFDDIAKGIIYEMEVNETSFQHEMTLH